MLPRSHLMLCIAGLGFGLLFGCRASGPPAGAPAVNAAFDRKVEQRDFGRPREGELPETGDTRVRTRCREYHEFGQRPWNKNWVDHWYVVTFDVLQVERGTWPDDTLSLLTKARLPTPESGIMLGWEWLYQPGAEFLFELRTDERPARIVGQARLTSGH